ncbi:MAG TPA: hypothetical protein VMP42_00360 [Actinomycetota bacterium]|nr:hypothetical protein [Actinomycetota bacterium]
MWIVIAVVALLALAGIAWAVWERRRREGLRERYGPEYERIEDDEGPRRATAELRDREKRRESLDIRPLAPEERSRFAADWDDLQGRFVDEPRLAVMEADRLVIGVMRARGYPMDDFDQRAADLSVDHPQVVDNYRTAHATAMRSEDAEVDTEELRRATLAYRALFEELLAEEAKPGYERTG